MITPENLVRHELIGLKVRIAEARNSQLAGTSGKVIDESRNTLTLEVGGREKVFPKEECRFEFSLPSGGKVLVEGSLLVARPEDRIKKKLKKW